MPMGTGHSLLERERPEKALLKLGSNARSWKRQRRIWPTKMPVGASPTAGGHSALYLTNGWQMTHHGESSLKGETHLWSQGVDRTSLVKTAANPLNSSVCPSEATPGLSDWNCKQKP